MSWMLLMLLVLGPAGRSGQQESEDKRTIKKILG